MHDEFEKIIENSIGKDSLDKILGIPNNDVKWDVGKHGEKLKTINNVIAFLKTDPDLIDLFKLNLFTGCIELSRKPVWENNRDKGSLLEDDDITMLECYLSMKYHWDINTTSVFKGVVFAAKECSYHPVKNYLESLTWDKTPRMNSWLIDYAGAEDNDYTKAVSQKFLLAAISRIMRPGCKFDHMVILEGAQGIGKSTMCGVLGGEWYKELSLFSERDKDTVDAMRGVWIAEVSELANFKRAEVEGVKAFISRQVDRVRLSYARLTQNFPRQCVFIGTINPDDDGYLKDKTGNRRFWPVACTKSDFNGLGLVRDQIWAEAYATFKNGGFKLWMEGEQLTQAMNAQKEREITEPWTETIESWLSNPENANGPHTSMEIALGALELDPAKVGQWEKTRIAQAMKELGWVNKKIRIDSKRTARKYVKAQNEVLNGRIVPGWDE